MQDAQSTSNNDTEKALEIIDFQSLLLRTPSGSKKIFYLNTLNIQLYLKSEGYIKTDILHIHEILNSCIKKGGKNNIYPPFSVATLSN